MPQHNHAEVGPEEPPSTVNATYVEPSATRILLPNEKIKSLYKLNTTTPYMLQRLSEGVYFFGGGFYTCAFYVGKKGVLLLDAPEHQGANIIQAIASVTKLPVTAIVYSHNHADHIISASAVLEASKAAGVSVRIIASTNTKEKMELLKCSLPPPTETVPWPVGSFDFEGTEVLFEGFTRPAHCDDAGIWLLKDEKVAYLPDLMNGDQPPFWRFATAECYTYYRPNINQLGALDWVHHVGGHGNVGSKQDIVFVNKYLDDLEKAVAEAKGKAQFGVGINLQDFNNHAALMAPWLDTVCKVVAEILRPVYGKFYGFELSVLANAQMVILESISYR